MGADGYDAGAANAGDDDAIGLVDERQYRLGRAAVFCGSVMPWPRLSLAPSIVTNDGQKPFTQEKSLCCSSMIDGPLAAELGFQRLHRHAFGLHAAIAAALADELVNDDALVRIRELVRLRRRRFSAAHV